MKTLIDQLAGYAAYHRDRRNIATHFVGIPMIVLGLQVLLARAAFDGAGPAGNAAVVLTALTCAYYLVLDLRYGVAMALLMGGAVALALDVATLGTAAWLGTGLGLFVVGWVFQAVGHVWEGRKPAFVDDLMGLIIGPLFVVAEAGFALGLRKPVALQIDERVGPVRTGRPLESAN